MTARMKCFLAVALFASLDAYGQTFTTRIARGFRQPVYATAAPGDDTRLFVLEKDAGRIRILDPTTETIAEDPFLIVAGLATENERGLLGLAFHPDYAANGKLYVYTSQTGGPADHRTQIFEYTVDGDPATSNMVDARSRRSVLRFDQPFGNHNGGWIGFDPTATGAEESYLYIATGDGGSGGDPQNNSQDITDNLLGKILRVDVDGDDFADDDLRNYAIPESNPFVGANGDDEIWAYGLRNPWRSSFDQATGDLWIGDVGQNAREEIDFVGAGSRGGQNFGWRMMEGNSCFDSGDALDGNLSCGDESLVPPVYEYRHGFGEFEGRSVTGGYLYRGPVRELEGHYLFADFVSDNIWSMDPHNGRVTNLNDALQADAGSARSSIASFAEDNVGNVYIVGIGGSVYRVDSSSRDALWVGEDATSGVAGDGVSWDEAANWIRDGVADVGFVAGDHLILDNAIVTSSEGRRVSALTFENRGELTINGQLDIVSGNIFVNGPDAKLDAERTSNSIKKLGAGHLSLGVRAPSETTQLALLEGATTLDNGGDFEVFVKAGATLDQHHGGESISLSSLSVELDGILSLTPNSEVVAGVPATELVAIDVSSLVVEGTLWANLPEGYEVPPQGQTMDFPLLTVRGGERTGEFADIVVRRGDAAEALPSEFLTVAWETVNDDDTLRLVAYNAIPGDADGNGRVDFNDFLRLSRHVGEPGDWRSGDFTGDGRVEFADFLLLADNFAGEATSAISAVPEPSASRVVLSAVVGAGLLLRRQR